MPPSSIVPRNLVEASHDLGASPTQTFWRVIFPLSIPGVVAGATFAFVLSLGDFLAPFSWWSKWHDDFEHCGKPLWRSLQLAPRCRDFTRMLGLVTALLFLSERLEKKWSFS